MPKVSVIIRSYNHEKFITECIESVLRQTFQDFEIIIVDDASVDKTVEKIAAFNDLRIQLFVHKNNEGGTTTRNHCLQRATGEYVALINSDDVWHEDKLSLQVKHLDGHPDVAVIFSDAQFIAEDGNNLTSSDGAFELTNRAKEQWLARFFYDGNCLCDPTHMIRRQVYSVVGVYNERFALMDDFDMWVRICLHYEIHILDQKLTKFRLLNNDKNAGSRKNLSVQIRGYFEYNKMLDSYLKVTDVAQFIKIFPQATKYGEVTILTIPYFLSRIALDSNNEHTWFWGLNVLYEFMQDKSHVDLLEKHYNFTNLDFIKLSGKIDPFHIEAIFKKDQRIINLNGQLSEIWSSWSWRITKPLRAVRRIFRRN